MSNFRASVQARGDFHFMRSEKNAVNKFQNSLTMLSGPGA